MLAAVGGAIMPTPGQEQPPQETANLQGSEGSNMMENGSTDDSTERETLILTMKRIFNNALKADTVRVTN